LSVNSPYVSDDNGNDHVSDNDMEKADVSCLKQEEIDVAGLAVNGDDDDAQILTIATTTINTTITTVITSDLCRALSGGHQSASPLALLDSLR